MRALRTVLTLAASAALLSAAAHAVPAAGKLRVVTTLRDLEDIVREVGGDRVQTRSVTRGRENLHLVQVRPSNLVAFKRADVFVQIGLSLEHAWVPGLMLAARNDRIEPGQPGFIDVSVGWEPVLDVPERITRFDGADVHPFGNPHINLHPGAGRHFAARVLEHLSQVDPGSKDYFAERHARYAEKLDAAEARWAPIGAALRGHKVVQYHEDFDYLCSAYGIEVVGALEPKPGISPTPGHIAELIGRMRAEKVRVVLTAVWSNNRHTRKVAEKSGARVLEAPIMVGGVDGADTWIGMMDWLHTNLANALGVDPEAATADR